MSGKLVVAHLAALLITLPAGTLCHASAGGDAADSCKEEVHMTKHVANQERFGSHRRLRPLPMTAARWTRGFWAERFKLCHETVIPKMKEALEHPDNSACLSNFRVGAGLEDGEHRVECNIWAENPKGEKTASGMAIAIMPSRS